MHIAMWAVLAVLGLMVAYSVLRVLRERSGEAQGPASGGAAASRAGSGPGPRSRGGRPAGSHDALGEIEHIRRLLEEQDRELDREEEQAAREARRQEDGEDTVKTKRIIRFTPIREALRALKHEFRHRQDIRIYRDARFEGWLMLGRRQVQAPDKDPVTGDISYHTAKRVYEALRVRTDDGGGFVLYRSAWPMSDEQWNQELLDWMGRDPTPQREEHRFETADQVVEYITRRVAEYLRSDLGRSLGPKRPEQPA